MYIKDVLYINTWYNETKKNKYQKKSPKWIMVTSLSLAVFVTYVCSTQHAMNN